jgi:cytoskeletal protein CcmA (bactofilin family)
MSSRIEAGMTIEGSIRGEGELEVAGRVRGALTIAGRLVVEETGIVEADVEAETIEVAGVLSGSATAHESVKVLEGGRVEARVRSPKMLVDDGAIFRGELQSTHDEEPAASARRLPARASRDEANATRAAAPRASVRGKAPQFAAPTQSASTAKAAPTRKVSASAPTREFPIASDIAAHQRSATPAPTSAEKRARTQPPKMPMLPRGRTQIARRGGES